MWALVLADGLVAPRSATGRVNQTAAVPSLHWCGFPHLYPVSQCATEKWEGKFTICFSASLWKNKQTKKHEPEEFTVSDVISCTLVLTVSNIWNAQQSNHKHSCRRHHFWIVNPVRRRHTQEAVIELTCLYNESCTTHSNRSYVSTFKASPNTNIHFLANCIHNRDSWHWNDSFTVTTPPI